MSPAVRHILGAAAVGVSTLGALIAAGTVTNAPEWLGVSVTVLGTIFAYLNVVPGQVGGTQEGLLTPSVVEPPAANIDESGQGVVGLILAVLLIILVVGLVGTTHSALWLFLLVLLLLLFVF